MHPIARHATALIFTACALVLSGCSLNPFKDEARVDANPPVIRSIALIQAIEPDGATAENRGAWLNLLGFTGVLIQKGIDINRASKLAHLFTTNDFQPAKELSEALHLALQQRGYRVEYFSSVPRDMDDPMDVRYDAIPSASDAWLALEIDSIGVLSGFTSTKFVPRLNIQVEMRSHDAQHELFSQSIDYGFDADELSEDEIPSSDKYRYGTFSEVMKRQAELIEGFRVGVAQIAESIARQIDDSGVALHAKQAPIAALAPPYSADAAAASISR